MTQLSYLTLYKEQFRSLRRLGAERAGQVLLAFMDYAEDGTEPQGLDDAQYILFDTLIDKYHRDVIKYNKLVERNRNNVNKRWGNDTSGKSGNTSGKSGNTKDQAGNTNCQHSNTSADNGTVTKPNQTTPNQTKLNQTKPTTTPNQQLEALAVDHSEILDAAVDAGFDKNNATFSKIIDLFTEYGKDIVLYGIDACVKQGVTKLAYLQKVCENKAKGVSKDGDGLSDAARAARDAGTFGTWL